MKTYTYAEKFFINWISDNLGYGYGTGELYTISTLKNFLTMIPDECDDRSYDYRNIEKVMGGPVTWLMIDKLCSCDIVEYGCSPRFAWLTDKGKKLRIFVMSRTSEELISLVCNVSEDEMCDIYSEDQQNESEG